MLMNISLLIRGLIQYKIRKSVEESKEELPRIGWDKRKLVNPTIMFVLETLRSSYLVKMRDGSYSYGFFDKYQQLQVTTILKLLEIEIGKCLD
jgi:hypothetical protein